MKKSKYIKYQQEKSEEYSSCSSSKTKTFKTKETQRSSSGSVINDDSEEELMFHWKDHKWELDHLFFGEIDIIKKGTSMYDDFWKFLLKYEACQKQNRVKKMCSKYSSQTIPNISKKDHDVKIYNKKDTINFSFKSDDFEKLKLRLPFTEQKGKRLSKKNIEEFKFIILLYLDFIQKQKFEKLKKLRNSQKNLPIHAHKDEILKTLKDNNVVVIAGDTGCGKSTQIPQYLMAAGYNKIACTQPRRIACISLCKRVSYETLNEYGRKVGYQIRFEKSKTDHTKIIFLTEGLLLRQVVTDPMLSMYDVIILDEIHERHLQTDFLLGIMKCLLFQRKDVKIVLMSATINIELFSQYFMGKAPVIQVPGRLFPINVQYFPVSMVEKTEKSEKLNPAPYIRIMQLIDSKYPSNERGDLLMFLSGKKEISTVVEAASLYAQQTKKWVILPLHSTLSIAEQEKVFDIAPENVRKCIVSTNIAETSVTIDGVRFVVDSGKVKEMSHDPICKMQKLKEFWISRASAEQRKGRSGRTGPGVCFRLYSESEEETFSQYSTPEIQRVPLDSLILQMISMGLPNIKLFPFIDPPSSENLDASLKSLKSHAALTENEKLTNIGQLLSSLPIDIALGKMLIMGSLFHQVEPVLSLAAAMSVQSPFTNRAFCDSDCINLNKDLLSDHGDPFTLLSAYREWLYVRSSEQEDSRRWCRKRGLEEQRFFEMTKLRQQFSQMLQDSGLQLLSDTFSATSSAERAQIHGQKMLLKQMKRELHNQGPRKAKVLKLNDDITVEGDDDDNDVSSALKDIDFKIRYDPKKLRELYKASKVKSSSDLILLKIILCSGIYPNVAIADEHNNYRKGSDQLFHSASKAFCTLHPNCTFSFEPEVLQISSSDIVELPDFSSKHPCSSKHQLLGFVYLLETNKTYLINTLRLPAAQILLLFSNSLDTNVDMSVIVCDNFFEIKFPQASVAQDLIFKATLIRIQWKKLLEIRLSSKESNSPNVSPEAVRLERELTVGLLDLFTSEPLYSVKRLLAADVKVLHYGPGQGDVALVDDIFGVKLHPNDKKGGVDLSDFLTYNCVIDTNSFHLTPISSDDSVCPYCDVELHLNVLERFVHMKSCVDGTVMKQSGNESEDFGQKKKSYFCDKCQKSFRFSIRDIMKHKNNHS